MRRKFGSKVKCMQEGEPYGVYDNLRWLLVRSRGEQEIKDRRRKFSGAKRDNISSKEDNIETVEVEISRRRRSVSA